MNREIELIKMLEDCIAKDLWYEINNENATILGSYINKLQEENKELKELTDKYEEEHSITFCKWLRSINKVNKAIEEIDKILELEKKVDGGVIIPQRYSKIKEILRGNDE